VSTILLEVIEQESPLSKSCPRYPIHNSLSQHLAKISNPSPLRPTSPCMVLTRSQYKRQLEMAGSSNHIVTPHDSDEDISYDDYQENIQNQKFQCLIEKALHEDPHQYFYHLASLGIKLPADFDISSIIENMENDHEKEKNSIDQNTNDRGKRTIDQNAPMEEMRKQLENLTQQISDLKTGTNAKNYYLEDIAPYSFAKSLIMKPFPYRFEVPKFDKYKGKGDPRYHIREFNATCLEVAHDETYLMRLFPRSLGSQAMEWFSRLPLGIKTFDELVNKFITHFSYNIEHEVSMLDLCNTKQKSGESFATFLQRWRQLASKCSYDIPEK